MSIFNQTGGGGAIEETWSYVDNGKQWGSGETITTDDYVLIRGTFSWKNPDTYSIAFYAPNKAKEALKSGNFNVDSTLKFYVYDSGYNETDTFYLYVSDDGYVNVTGNSSVTTDIYIIQAVVFLKHK